MSLKVLLSNNVISKTMKSGDEILLNCGRAAYTTARSVCYSRVFRFSHHIDRLFTSVSGLFPEEQKHFNITREEVRQTVLNSVTKARDYLFEVDPSIRSNKLDVKFSIIIERPSEQQRLPISVVMQPVTKCRSPPIICDVYNVIRHNALVKDSLWVKQRDSYYKKSGSSVEEILLCENDQFYEGGQSNFFAIKDGKVFTKGEGVLQGTVRTMVLTICEKLGIPVSLDAPRLSEIGQWDACFITSTSRFVMNINTIRENGKVLREFTKESDVLKRIVNEIDSELHVESEEVFTDCRVC